MLTAKVTIGSKRSELPLRLRSIVLLAEDPQPICALGVGQMGCTCCQNPTRESDPAYRAFPRIKGSREIICTTCVSDYQRGPQAFLNKYGLTQSDESVRSRQPRPRRIRSY